MLSSRHRFGFWAVAAAYLGVMAFSTLPSPLYGLYQVRDGFSTFTITLIYGAYAIGVVAALVLGGHVSDWYGRRRVLLPAIATSIVSAALFLLWKDLPGLLAGRIVNGLSVGIVAATATAWLSELHAVAQPAAGPRRSQLVASGVNLGGLGLGPLIAGALATWTSAPLVLPYVIVGLALVVAFAVILFVPETRAPADPRPAYRVQRIAVPREGRAAFFAAAAGAFVAFGALGLFTGLAGTFLIGTLHEPSHLLAGATVFAMFASGVVAQAATAGWEPRPVLALGGGLMLAGLTAVVAAAWLPSPSLALFMSGGMALGAGAGAVFKGAVATVISVAPASGRAEALAGLFLAGYLGLSVPVVGAGVALVHVSPRVTLLGFAILIAAGVLAAAPRLLGRSAHGGGVPALAAH